MINIREKILVEFSVEEELPAPMLLALQSTNTVYISGRPLHIFPDKSEAEHLAFDACPDLSDKPVLLSRVFRQRVPLVGHRHLSPEYIECAGYPAVQCFAFNGDEIIMGIRRQLGFAIRTKDQTEAISI